MDPDTYRHRLGPTQTHIEIDLYRNRPSPKLIHHIDADIPRGQMGYRALAVPLQVPGARLVGAELWGKREKFCTWTVPCHNRRAGRGDRSWEGDPSPVSEPFPQAPRDLGLEHRTSSWQTRDSDRRFQPQSRPQGKRSLGLGCSTRRPPSHSHTH